MPRSRYSIGIDLGTCNSALAYIDHAAAQPRSKILEVSQLEAPGKVNELAVLPSFIYLPTTTEKGNPDFQPPFQLALTGSIVGAFAKQQIAILPGRVISSAKSWLCHGGVDREAAILPWGSTELATEEKLSPVSASAYYLRYLLDFWNSSLGTNGDRFEAQDITITVPASFDDTARRLTLTAAKLAGYPAQLRLIEEPQAAFYHWLECHDLNSNSIFSELNTKADRPLLILVCDIGGGTSDFSLFEISFSALTDTTPEIRRVAVSEHLLLGGDNIDLSIAHLCEDKLSIQDEVGTVSNELSPRQWRHLVHSSRLLKEKVLSDEPLTDTQNEFSIVIPAEGANLFASSISVTITRSELTDLILEGFFPSCPADSRPIRHRAALREWGLPYAQDSAVTRHLAAFLNGQTVDAILFNGGTLHPPFLRQRLLQAITQWQNGHAPVELSTETYDLAVAQGAAFYSWATASGKQTIKGGSAHSIYLELQRTTPDETPKLLCILPQGYDDAKPFRLENMEFALLVGQPVRFQLYHSTQRNSDMIGDLISFDPEELHPLPPLQTVLSSSADFAVPADGYLNIKLEVSFSELGLLALSAVYFKESKEEHRWELEFNLRKDLSSAEGEDLSLNKNLFPAQTLHLAQQKIAYFYGKKKTATLPTTPKTLLAELEKILGPRADWNSVLLRSLWPSLASGITRRGRSVEHESTWLYLAGYVLRPGFGMDLDDWRMQELWRAFKLGMSFPREKKVSTAWWMMWRRVAAGLTEAQQKELFSKALPRLQDKNETDPELWRLAGSLERLELPEKLKLGEMLIKKICAKKTTGIEQFIWAWGRLCTRVPLYTSIHLTVPANEVERWLSSLTALDWSKGDLAKLNSAAAQACRITLDRERDLSKECREAVIRKMQQAKASPRQLLFLTDYVEVTTEDQTQLFGEELPSGLILISHKVRN